MSRAVRYFRLQLKRFFKQAVVVMLLSAMLIGAMALVFYGIFSGSRSDDRHSLVNVGIVGDQEDSFLSLAIGGLKSLDSSRFSLDIRLMDNEEKAAEAIRRGDLVAYIVIPEDFFDRAFYGDVQKVTCVTAGGATDFGTQITQELMTAVTELVENSQKAVYGFQQAAMDDGVATQRAYDLGTEVAFDAVNTILRRETAYEVKEIGSGGGSDVKDVYACGVLVLLIMLWGITCCTAFHARSATLNKVLSSKGTGAVTQVLCEYAAYFVFMAAAMGFFALLFLCLSPLFSDFLQATRYDVASLIGGSLLPILTISAMQFFLYEISDNPVPGVLLQFFCAIGMGYVCGCIYPSFMFPRGVQDAALWLPAWHCRIWFNELLADSASLSTSAALFGYFVLFILLSAAIRSMRIKRAGGAA